MLGGINRAIDNLSSGSDCTGETTTEEEFIYSIYYGLLENGIGINEARQMDIVKYFNVMANKQREKQEKENIKTVQGLLF